MTRKAAQNWFLSGQAVSPAPGKAASEFVDAQMALAAPRKMMDDLRRMMAQDLSPEQKIDRIVTLVARELRADACACFVLRAGEMIELFSTFGLPPETAHKAKMRVGEGIVGDIAASGVPVTIPDLPTHPQYAPRPETGGGALRAFCGVPILRGSRVHGVLAVQNRLPRGYGDEVVDILQTVALLLAELIVAGGIVSKQELNAGYAGGGKPEDVSGVSFGRGLAIGTVVLYEPAMTMGDILVEDPQAEKARLAEALSGMHGAIDKMLNRNKGLTGTESRDILEAYQMFAKDRGWLSRIESSIDKGLSAEAAVQRVQNETRVRMTQMNDPYIRDRLQDLEDLSNRLRGHLMKSRCEQRAHKMPDSIILVARAMGPAALLDYDRAKLKGVVLEQGSASNHVAIVARSLGIPVVGQCRDILNFVEEGDQAIVDGDNGAVYINPSDYTVELYARSIDTRRRRSRSLRRQAPQQTATKNGLRVSVMMNAGLPSELDSVAAVGAEGIGLFRTELAFMAWQKYPLVVTQAELYGDIMDRLNGKPVTFRTLDIGGDKPLPYFNAPQEENPALGWRAVRIGMDRPAVLRTQFRALIMGARGRPLRIMLPFVTEVAEFDRARALLEMEKARAAAKGQPVPEKIELGVMIEVPALLFQLDALLKSADFVSVGTNDLMQYLYAADRNNHAIRRRYDALSPAMLAVLRDIAARCKAAGVPVSVCGEMAGNPLEAMVLVALGYESLSAPAQSVEAVRQMLPTLDTGRLVPYLEQLISSREHSLREQLAFFAKDHDVQIMTAA
jgi:phosphotransferase system enzyme I (PtsP)